MHAAATPTSVDSETLFRSTPSPQQQRQNCAPASLPAPASGSGINASIGKGPLQAPLEGCSLASVETSLALWQQRHYPEKAQAAVRASRRSGVEEFRPQRTGPSLSLLPPETQLVRLGAPPPPQRLAPTAASAKSLSTESNEGASTESRGGGVPRVSDFCRSVVSSEKTCVKTARAKVLPPPAASSQRREAATVFRSLRTSHSKREEGTWLSCDGTSAEASTTATLFSEEQVSKSQVSKSAAARVGRPPLLSAEARGGVGGVSLPENTLIVLDYDDTLLPTNWVAVQQRVGLNDAVAPPLLEELRRLQRSALITLQMCLNFGRVVLVTNASKEWVARSATKFIPELWLLLQQHAVPIYSARDQLEQLGLPQRQWKVRVFREIVQEQLSVSAESPPKACCSVVSIGDGDGERDACIQLAALVQSPRVVIKSVKLLTQPSCEQLRQQHLLLVQVFPEIMEQTQSLDMAILGADESEAFHSAGAALSPEEGASGRVCSGSSGAGGEFARSGVQAQEFPLRSKQDTRLLSPLHPQSAAATDLHSANTDVFVDFISHKLQSQHSAPSPTPASSLRRAPTAEATKLHPL